MLLPLTIATALAFDAPRTVQFAPTVQERERLCRQALSGSESILTQEDTPATVCAQIAGEMSPVWVRNKPLPPRTYGYNQGFTQGDIDPSDTISVVPQP